MIKRVVTIGGGNGSPVINEALLLTGRVKHIDAISAVFDTGGATGKRRTDSRGQELAYSDPMRNLLSLVNPSQGKTNAYQALVQLMTNRSWGKVLGQDVFAHFHENGRGFDSVQEQLTKLTCLNFMGKILPATTCSTNIVFETASGRIYTGEDKLDTHAMSKDMIKDMWLEKKAYAYKETLKAIKKASIIFFSCGSIYGSVFCNTLPIGIKEAFKKTKARVFIVTNLVSTRNETHNFKPANFIHLIKKYAGIKPNGLIVPNMTRGEFENKFKDAAKLYSLDHSFFLGWEKKELEKTSKKEEVEIIFHNATTIIETKTNEKVVRHDPKELSKTLKKLL